MDELKLTTLILTRAEERFSQEKFQNLRSAVHCVLLEISNLIMEKWEKGEGLEK